MSSTTWRRRSAVVGATGAIMGLIYGYDQGAISGAILYIKDQYHLSTFMQETVTSAVVVGMVIGALVAGRIANAIGRKPAMIVISVGYVVFAVASGIPLGLAWLIVMRFLLGLVIGLCVVAVPLFIAESVPPSIRGRMVIIYQLATTTGILVAYFADLGFAGSKDWEAMLAVSAAAALVVLALVFRLPDTPRWYMMKGRRDEALAVLRRSEDEDLAQAEILQLEDDLSHSGSSGFRAMFRRPFTKAAVFALGLGFLVQITGINAIVYYAPTILQEVGFKSAAGAILGTVVIQAAAIAVELVAFGIVDRVGRRPVLLGGIAAMVIADVLLLGVYADGHFVGIVAALAFTGFMLFHMGYSFGFGSLGWVYASETFPARLRASGAAAQLTMNNLANLIVALFYLSAVQTLGGVGTWTLLLVLAVIAFVFVFRLAPEAKGRQLEEIRAYWDNGGRWPDKNAEQAAAR
ncbi:MAG: sugar porter family MFS transporter [Streptosporangiales bacterium]|nr:sugar porter family MFS transporter [Streptosporangiales bacterium]